MPAQPSPAVSSRLDEPGREAPSESASSSVAGQLLMAFQAIWLVVLATMVAVGGLMVLAAIVDSVR